jgi:hypothetical protein
MSRRNMRLQPHLAAEPKSVKDKVQKMQPAKLSPANAFRNIDRTDAAALEKQYWKK